MATPKPSPSKRQAASNLSPEKLARLEAELRSPYRGLRHFVYLAFGASGGLGAFIFMLKVLAGQDLEHTLPNFALQIGLVAAMVWLFKIDRTKSAQKPL